MPYITEERRRLFDYEIERLQEKLLAYCAEEGDYNYIISRLISTMMIDGPRYKLIARATGVLHNVAAELYRRIGSPYEDSAIEMNGDIPEFESIVSLIRRKQPKR